MIRLEKGQNHVLGMNLFHAGLGWDVKEDDSSEFEFDLDVSAFLVGANKKVISDDYLVFYNSEKRLRVDSEGNLITPIEITPDTMWGADNKKMRHESRPVDPELSVIGSLDDESGENSEDGDDEVMDLNLTKVSQDVQEIIICVSIFEHDIRKQNFGQVERAYIRLYKPGQKDGEGEFIYDLTEDFSICASVEFCRLYRKDNGWKIQALGLGHKGGLEELVSKYTK